MSKIRFLKAASYYDGFLNDYYFNGVYKDALSYEINHKALMNLCYAWADFWKINLEKRGDFEAEELVLNAELLQKKWASEKGFKYSESNWKKEIFFEQIKNFKPDVFFLQDVYNHHDYLVNLKKEIPSLKIIIGWDGILYHKKEVFSNCDFVFSCVDDTCIYYTNNGFKTWFFKFCFEKSVLSKLKPTTNQHPVSFVGTIFLGEGYHTQRLELLAAISRKTKVDLWIGAFKEQNKIDFKHQLKRILDRKFCLLRDIHTINTQNKGSVYGLDMFQVLKDSFITFNSHGDNSPKKAANMRLIESTGCGTCLLTDWKENLPDYFEPDTEIVTYKSAAEAVEKINYLKKNPAERNKIAKAGQKKTFEKFSYEQRMNEFAELIYSVL